METLSRLYLKEKCLILEERTEEFTLLSQHTARSLTRWCDVSHSKPLFKKGPQADICDIILNFFSHRANQ